MRKVKQSPRKYILALGIGIVVLSLFFGFVLSKNNSSKSSDAPLTEKCNEDIRPETVRGNSMEPMIKDGTDIKVDFGAYKCGTPIKHDDIVIFKNSATETPYIKSIKAIPGDAITLDTTSGTLSINDEIMKNSLGETYYFDKNELNFLSLYIVSGRLQGDAYFVFGDNTHQSRDSRKIGAISALDVLGKIVE